MNVEGLDRADLHRCLADFGIDLDSAAVSLAAEGMDNLNLLIDAGGQRFVLRRYDRTPPKEVGFEVSLIRHLRRNAFPTPGIRATTKGEHLSALSGRPAALFEYLAGRHGNPNSLEDARSVARILARLHELTRGFAPPCERTRTDLNRLRRLETIQSHFTRSFEGVRAFLHDTEGLLKALRNTLGGAALPSGAVHHDPNANNVLLDQDNRIIALLDFDESHMAPLLMDLASLLHYWAKSEDPPFLDVERASELVRTYSEQRSLSSEEVHLLPSYVRFFYAGDAAEHLWRQALENRNTDLHLDSCNSYRAYAQLSSSHAWAQDLIAGVRRACRCRSSPPANGFRRYWRQGHRCD